MNSTKQKILLLYHTGSGSTETIAKVLFNELTNYSEELDIIMEPINYKFDYKRLDEYKTLILGFPTYHTEPSKSMKDFVKNLPAITVNKAVYLFTTCALMSVNSNRILALELEKKGYLVRQTEVIRGPASDGAVLSPIKLGILFRYPKSTKKKIESFANNIRTEREINKERIPRFNLLAIINWPNKILGKVFALFVIRKLQVDVERCINCQICIKQCNQGCWSEGITVPIVNLENCEFCYGCIHQCPTKAIFFSTKMKDRPRLDKKFYKEKFELLTD